MDLDKVRNSYIYIFGAHGSETNRPPISWGKKFTDWQKIFKHTIQDTVVFIL